MAENKKNKKEIKSGVSIIFGLRNNAFESNE